MRRVQAQSSTRLTARAPLPTPLAVLITVLGAVRVSQLRICSHWQTRARLKGFLFCTVRPELVQEPRVVPLGRRSRAALLASDGPRPTFAPASCSCSASSLHKNIGPSMVGYPTSQDNWSTCRWKMSSYLDRQLRLLSLQANVPRDVLGL